jgi:hypothetical protein
MMMTWVMVLIVPLLDDTSFENGYPTAEEFVCSAVCEERICNSCTALTLFVHQLQNIPNSFVEEGGGAIFKTSGI